MRRTTAAGALLVLLAAGLGQSQARAADAGTPVNVILDASGSMLAPDAPGPRIDAAKQAVNGLVAALPSDARVGLEVYGTGTGSAPAEKAAGCRDIRQVVPVGPLDRAAFTRAVSGIRAAGYTPIGESLRAAVRALPAEGPRSVVLVSDGEDTCAPPDPCTVARELKSQGVDLVVHTIGFRVGAAARNQLACIASATGGTYRDATTGSDLASALRGRVTRALRPYSAVGTPIEGAKYPADAPLIGTGQYLDTYEKAGTSTAIGSGTTKYYAVDLRAGDTPYFSATLVPRAARVGFVDGVVVDLELQNDNGTTCVYNVRDFDLGTFGKVRPPTAVLAPGPVGGSRWPSSCSVRRTGRYLLKVGRTGDAFSGVPLALELAVRIEPPAGTSGLPPAATAQEALLPPTPTTPRDTDGGSSYNDAPLLAPGSYRDTVVSGESRYYKVHLDWGQRLNYRVDEGVADPSLGTLDGAATWTYMHSPLRADLTQPPGVTSLYAFGGAKAPKVLNGSTVAPVRYLNRGSTPLKGLSLAGDYYLEIATGFTTKQITIPLTITVAASGSPDREPSYAAAAVDEPSPSPSPSAAVAAPADEGDGGGGGTAAWVWALAGTGAVLVVGGGATAVRRMRRPPPGTP